MVKAVRPKSILYTDEFLSYDGIRKLGYDHRRIEHNAKIYVQGDIHTNSIEGFCSLVKGGIDGICHKVGKDYLQSYLNEYAFRYNRGKDDEPMFSSFLQRIVRTGQGV